MLHESLQPGELSLNGTPIALIPWPKQVTAIQGRTAALFEGTVTQSADMDDPHGFLARELADELAAATGGCWHADRGMPSGDVTLDISGDMEPRSYTVDMAGSRIAVIGGDLEGVRYGVQTVRQMLRQCGGVLPAVHIEDAPAFAVRGYYLDVTRGRVPTLDWLEQWACELELCKYNQLHLYIEHSFAFPGLSEAWRGLDPLHAEDIMAFDAFCAQRGIELVPSVSTFGHLYTVLRTREMRGLGEFPEDADRPFSFIERQEHHTLNITLDEALDFSIRLIDQYMPLFSSNKFNIGADETFDLGKGRSRRTAERIGTGRMYVDYVNKLCAHIVAQGHEPVLWGDIVLQSPDAIADLDRNAILLNWQYDPDCTDEPVRTLAEAGATQYVCPAVHGWNRMLPALHDAWRNIDNMGTYGIAHHAQGFLLTDWGDYGHVNDPRLSLPGMMYGADCSWRGKRTDFDELNRRVSMLMLADTDGSALAQWDRISRRPAFSWHDVVRFMELDYGDATLNRDVRNTFAASACPQERAVAGAESLEQARRLFLESSARRLAGVPDADSALEDMQQAFAAGRVKPSSHPVAGVMLRAAAGQDLLDACGWWLAVDAGVLPASGAMPAPVPLAGELERWFEGYRAQWRTVSRESELDRISGIVWRLADMLRGMAKNRDGER